MAKRIEVRSNPIQSIIESKQSPDIKVKMILQELYQILKRYGFDHIVTSRGVGDTLVREEEEVPHFDFSLLSPDIDEAEAHSLVKELRKVLSWDVGGSVKVGGKPIRSSNIYALVNYLVDKEKHKKPSWYDKVKKSLRSVSLPKSHKSGERSLLWSTYGKI